MQAESEGRGDGGQACGLQIDRERIEGVPAQHGVVALLDMPEQHVKREPDRQIENDTDHGRGDRRQCPRQMTFAAQPLLRTQPRRAKASRRRAMGILKVPPFRYR